MIISEFLESQMEHSKNLSYPWGEGWEMDGCMWGIAWISSIIKGYRQNPPNLDFFTLKSQICSGKTLFSPVKDTLGPFTIPAYSQSWRIWFLCLNLMKKHLFYDQSPITGCLFQVISLPLMFGKDNSPLQGYLKENCKLRSNWALCWSVLNWDKTLTSCNETIWL